MTARTYIALTALALIMAMAVGLWHLENKVQDLKVENKRLNGNFKAATTKIIRYKTADSLKAVRIGVLSLSKDEAERYNADLIRGIENMGLRVKDIERASAVGIQSAYRVIQTLRDSIKHLKNAETGRIDTVPFLYAKYEDKWLTFYQEQIGNSITTDITTRDSIVIVQHWERYKFLWFRWGKKNHYEDIVNHNPHSEVSVALSVEIKRKQKR